MADSGGYERSFSFTGYSAANPTSLVPGPELDNEFENIERAIGQTQDALDDIRRDDGALNNGIVTEDSLSEEVRAALGQPGPPGADSTVPGPPGTPGQGVPVGGGTGQVLTKASAVDYATIWQTPAVFRPETYGAVADGTTNDTAAIVAAAAAALAAGAHLTLTAGKTYAYSKLVLPAGLVVTAAGSVLRALGLLSVAADRDLTIGANGVIDELTLTRPNAGTNTYWVEIGAGTSIGKLSLKADTPWLMNGVYTTGQDVRIGICRIENVERGFDVNANAGVAVQTSNFWMGFLDITNYRRGLYIAACKRWRLDGYHMSVRSAGAATLGAGQNGILLGGVSEFVIGDGYIGNSGEHALRIGGNEFFQTTDFQIGQVFVRKARGCALKINPSGYVGQRARRGKIAGVVGIDIGEGPTSDNQELIRVSHAEDIDVGYGFCATESYTEAAQWAIALNNVAKLRVGSLRGVFNGGIRINSTSDADNVTTFPGDVTDVVIENYSGTVGAGNAVSIDMPGLNVGNIEVKGIDIGGFPSRFADITVGAYTGPVVFSGVIRGAVFPGINTGGAAPGDDLLIDFQWGSGRFAGRPLNMNTTKAMQQWNVGVGASLANVPSTGLSLNTNAVASAVNGYGGSVEFSRIGSGRRGAAIVMKQTGAGTNNSGLAIWTGPNTAATDALTESCVFDTTAITSAVKIIAPAASSGKASITLPHGAAPTTPANGDVWTTTAGLFARINSVTKTVATNITVASSAPGSPATNDVWIDTT